MKAVTYKKWWTVEKLEVRQDTDQPHPLDGMNFPCIETFRCEILCRENSVFFVEVNPCVEGENEL